MNTPFYLSKLRETLLLRKHKSPRYSLRALGRDIGVHPSTLSQVMKGTRLLPLKTSKSVVEKLKLNAQEKTRFLESLKNRTLIDQIQLCEDDQRFMIDDSYGKVLAEWEHYSLLTLFDVPSFKPEPKIISKRLNITLKRSNEVLANLLQCGLLKKTSAGIKKTHVKVRTTEDVSSAALKKSHIQALAMAKKKLETIDVEMRDFSSMDLAIDLKKIPEAKAVIREFRMKMAALLKDGNKTDVFQLAVQFYPMTSPEK